MKSKCPECLAELEICDDAVTGEIVECSECGATLEVRWMDNGELKLVAVEMEEEDWGE